MFWPRQGRDQTGRAVGTLEEPADDPRTCGGGNLF